MKNLEFQQINLPTLIDQRRIPLFSAEAFRCSYCESKYSQKYNLKAHIKKITWKLTHLKILKPAKYLIHTNDQKPVEENNEKKDETVHELTEFTNWSGRMKMNLV